MKLVVHYSIASLHEAARYIWDNNPHAPLWHNGNASEIDIVNDIREMFIRDVKKNYEVILREKRLSKSLESEFVHYSATGGYYILYNLWDEPTDDSIEIEVTILVDPSIGKPEGYVAEVIDM